MENSIIKKPNLSQPMLRIRKSLTHQILSTPKLSSSHRGSLFQNSVDNTSNSAYTSQYANSNRDDYLNDFHPKVENTFQLGPIEGQKFNVSMVEKIGKS